MRDLEILKHINVCAFMCFIQVNGMCNVTAY